MTNNLNDHMPMEDNNSAPLKLALISLEFPSIPPHPMVNVFDKHPVFKKFPMHGVSDYVTA